MAPTILEEGWTQYPFWTTPPLLMSLLVLSAQDVATASATLDTNMLVRSMASVFVKLHKKSSDVILPHRTSVVTESYTALFMPGRMDGLETTIKVVSVPKKSSGLDGVPATTLVLDEETGLVKAVINASSLTALRNAAGSLLATQTAGISGPEVLTVFGAGKQIEAHTLLFLKAYSTIKRCIIVNRSLNARTYTLCASLQNQYPHVQVELIKAVGGVPENGFNLEEAVRSADIICTATSSMEPLFCSGWVKAGAHINLIGSYTPKMREVDNGLFDRSGIVMVESKEACILEAGELIAAGITSDGLVNLGELVDMNGNVDYKALQNVRERRHGDVTVFKSVGVGLQDTAITNLVLEKALGLGLGTDIPGYN